MGQRLTIERKIKVDPMLSGIKSGVNQKGFIKGAQRLGEEMSKVIVCFYSGGMRESKGEEERGRKIAWKGRADNEEEGEERRC